MKAGFVPSGVTSFHGETIRTTPRHLIGLSELLGSGVSNNNDGEDKTNFYFNFETDDGEPFGVYDYKEGGPLNLDSYYEFHIGHRGGTLNGSQILKELKEALEIVD